MNNWAGKRILCLGDSLTEAGVWPQVVAKRLDAQVTLHCKGGLGMTAIVDGGESIVGKLGPLTAAMVADQDLIIFYAGYNDRGLPDGELGDVYPKQQTIAGLLQHVIDTIYARLEEAGNLTCQLLIVTPHCVGTYSYIEVDGYHDYPSGSGRSVRTLATMMAKVAAANSLPCCNLWENSGINRYTWDVFANAPGADMVHCSPAGYTQIGAVIAGAIVATYGQ